VYTELSVHRISCIKSIVCEERHCEERHTVKKDTVKKDTVKKDTVKKDTVKKDTVKKDTVKTRLQMILYAHYSIRTMNTRLSCTQSVHRVSCT